MVFKMHLKYLQVDFSDCVWEGVYRKGLGVSHGEKVLSAAVCGLLMPFELISA